MYQLVFYVPTTHVEEVKEAIFAEGAGYSKDYSHCTFQTLGTGQFKPSANANPFIGERGEIAQVEEYRVETIVEKDKLKAVIAALKQAHPYEQPAYSVFELYQQG
jgi:structural hemagglutinin/hemolysin toxin protein RtxA